MNKMTYEEALAYIHSVSWLGSRPGLERISELCEKIGHPEEKLKFVHVAGTNGKGSVCRMIAGILEEAGYKVGLFTSPYVEEFNERIIFCGENISDNDLAEETEYVKQFADTMQNPPTEFELITAIALSYYARKSCDIVVFECGLGGRLDSTNIIKTPVLSIITGIDLDHTAILGSTSAEIAFEKAGIIKKGVPVLFGEGDDEAEKVIRTRSTEMESEYYRTDFGKIHDITSDLTGTEFVFDTQRVRINLHGIYQTKNTATVLTAIKILRGQGFVILDESIERGLLRAKWKARFEILCENPLTVYDGAHNPQGIRGAVENINHYLSPLSDDGKVALLMGVMADKDHTYMIKTLSPLVRKVFTVTPNVSRSLASTGVKAEFVEYGAEYGVQSESFDVLKDGVFSAMQYAKETKTPLICLGSLYMYADVKKAVNEYCTELL